MHFKFTNMLFGIIVILVATNMQVNSQPPGLTNYTSSYACHGNVNPDVNYINATCSAGYVIAVSKIMMGANPKSDQCPLYYDSSFDFNVCCTNGAGTDCLFPLYGTNNVYHEQCNGKPTCSTQTQHQQFDNSMCNVSLYGAVEGAFSNYMFMQHYCIEEPVITGMCQASSLTKENTTIYLWNRDFKTSFILTSDTMCTCSVEIDNCNAQIYMYTMYKHLTGNEMDSCDQNITISDSDNNTLAGWTCSDNSLTIDTNTLAVTYLRVELNNQRNTSDGKFWLGFKASLNSNITISCPASSQKHCMSTTTTTTVSSTTVLSSTSSAPSNVTNSTTTTNTNLTSTTTNSTPTTELATTTTIKATFTTSVGPDNHTIQPGSDGLTAAVIALCIICALLVLAVIILSCCLYSRCREQHTDDAEKASSDRKLLITLSSESLKNKTTPEENREIINNIPPITTTDNTTGFSTTNGFLKVMSSDVGCQTNNINNNLKQSEFACQVNITLPNITTDDAICQTYDTEPVLTRADFECQVEVISVEVDDKAVSTELTVTPTEDCASQTLKVKLKHKKIQCDQTVSLNTLEMISTYSQTHEQENQILVAKADKGLLDTVEEGKSTYQRTAEDDVFMHNSEQSLPTKMRKKRIKKRKVHIPDDQAQPVESEREEPTFNYDVHEVRTETPANVKFRNSNSQIHKMPLDSTDDTDIKENVNETKQIHVPSEPDSIQDFAEEKQDSDDMPELVKRKLKIQRVLVQSFFAQEKRDEQVEKILLKKYKKMRSKKKLKAQK